MNQMMYVCVAIPDLVWGHQFPGSCGLGGVFPSEPLGSIPEKVAEPQTRAARGQAVPTELLGSPASLSTKMVPNWKNQPDPFACTLKESS